MDLRVKKTERAIRNAFFELVQTKPVERITVKELAEKAEINKTTFYAHYETIYDLVETLENEIIAHVTANISELSVLFDDPKDFVRSLYQILSSFHVTDTDFHPLSRGSQNFTEKLSRAIYDEAVRQKILPNRYASLGTLLTFLLNGMIGVKNSGDEITDEEIEFLATFIEGGIRALPEF